MVGRLFHKSRSVRETLPEVRKWLGDSVGGPEVVEDPSGGVELVERPFQRSGTVREILPVVRNLTGALPISPEVVWRP